MTLERELTGAIAEDALATTLSKRANILYVNGVGHPRPAATSPTLLQQSNITTATRRRSWPTPQWTPSSPP
eukprot:8856152-Pyramimonas_sp.AAC.1